MPLNEFWRNDVTLKPSYGNSPHDAQVALDLMAARRVPVADMITHRLPLEETPQGFRLMATPGGHAPEGGHPAELIDKYARQRAGMVTLCLCVTMRRKRFHGHPKTKGDHVTPASRPSCNLHTNPCPCRGQWV